MMAHRKFLVCLVLVAGFMAACAGTLDVRIERSLSAGPPTAGQVGTATPPPETPAGAAPTQAAAPASQEPATATPLPDATAASTPPPLMSASATPPNWIVHTYHNAAYGILFEYPAEYDERHDLGCVPRTLEDGEGVTVTLGLRSSVRLIDANGLSSQDYASQTLAAKALTPDAAAEEMVAGQKAVRVDYRFGGTDRFGTFTVVQLGDRLAVFEMTAGGFCEIPGSELFEPEAYEHMKATFQLGPPSGATAINPIIGSFGGSGTQSVRLLGGTQNGSWLDAAATLGLLGDDTLFQLYTPAGYVGATTGKMPANPRYDICPSTYWLPVEPPAIAGDVIGLEGQWNAMPRVSEQLSTDTELYRQAIGDLLRANGLTQPEVNLTQVLRVDLEGDGNDEVLISASRFAESTGHSVESGDYSAVVLRTVVNNQAVTVPLVNEFYLEAEELAFPRTYSPGVVLDLNGDGRMEVVVKLAYWEGQGAEVYEVENDRVRKVLSVGC